jgi:BirA family transcriptional regulator, biotin operon repressor / biotin---[acetyl-CoA-carboxylase] ligase
VAAIRVIARDTVGSTNEEALLLARAGEHGPLWVTARTQSAGRGRRGRSWVSEPGNLYASLLLTDPAPPERAPELSFVAALAVYDAVADAAPGLAARLLLKWPNDLLVDRKKFAGLLIEAETGSPSIVVIGVGINCGRHPADASYPATDLASAGAAVAPDRLFEGLAPAMAKRLAQWRGGFAQIRADWLARAAAVGEDVRIRLADRDVAGRFETLDERGRLVLRLPDGSREAIAAGDVVALAGWPAAA